MTGPRHYSPISIDGDGNDPSVLKASDFLKEKSAFRAVRQGVVEDEYPSFLMQNVIIYNEDGTLGNLLNAELEGTRILRGQLVIDEEHKDLLPYLRNPKYNGKYIEARVHTFSMMANPTMLWALGEERWFEIHPAEAYEEMFGHLIDGIGIYFDLTEIYEQTGRGKHGKARLAALTIDDVFSKLASNDGRGLTLENVGERIKSHAQFLLSQLRKGTTFQNSVIFRWLAAECEDIHNALRSKTGQEPVYFTKFHHAEPETPEYLRTPSPETFHQEFNFPVLLKSNAEKGTLNTLQFKNSREPTPDPGAGHKKSRSIFVTSSRPDMNALEAILWVADTCIKEGLKTHANITFGFVVQWLNYNFSLRSELVPRLSDHLFCKAVVTKYAAQVHSMLPPQYANSPLARELLATVKSKAPLSNKGSGYDAKLSAEIDPILFNRRKPNTRRFSNDEKSLAPSKNRMRSTRGILNDDSSPGPSMRTPHASKSVPALQSGRPSGKKSTLRVPNTTGKRGHDSMDIDRPTTKRHRTGSSPEVEMGPSSPSLSPTPSPSDTPTTYPFASGPSKPIFTLRTERLPTFAATGPNGSYVCGHSQPGYNCPFILRDPNPEDIRQHELLHLNILDKERLVQREAGLGNFSASNLIERLKALGHAEQLVPGAAGGESVVLPVREAVHSRYAF